MMFRVINDCHCGGPHEKITYNELLTAITDSPHPVIYLGDNIDIKNCPKKDVELWLIRLAYVKKLIQLKNGKFIRGNHELDAEEGLDELMEVVRIGEGAPELCHFTHGHIPWWGRAEAKDWIASKKRGAGFFKRNFLVRPVAAFRHLVPVKLTDRFMEYMDMLPTNCKTIVTGHKHPESIFTGVYNGRRYMVLMQGVNDIEV